MTGLANPCERCRTYHTEPGAFCHSCAALTSQPQAAGAGGDAVEMFQQRVFNWLDTLETGAQDRGAVQAGIVRDFAALTATPVPAVAQDDARAVEAEPMAWMRRHIRYRERDGRTDGERVITERQVFPDDVPLYTRPSAAPGPSAGDIHTCSYECQRPACIKAQRDELVARHAPEVSAEDARVWREHMPPISGENDRGRWTIQFQTSSPDEAARKGNGGRDE